MRPKLSASDSKGFTLIELGIVVVIIGLITAIAIPAFQNFVKKAKMVEGEAALSEIKRLEERHFAEYLVYSNNPSTLGYTSPLQYYNITIQLNGAGPPPFFYQATATANLDKDPDLDAWLFTSYTDGTSELKHGCIPDGVGAVQFDCTD
jgi:type IV pilus assembly protein PilE